MKLFHRKVSHTANPPTLIGAGRERLNPFGTTHNGHIPLSGPETRLYEAIREGVPLVDAAILKTVRLAGGFRVTCGNPRAQALLDRFSAEVPVGGTSQGLEPFLASYLDSLIFYGNALGEIVPDYTGGRLAGLYHASLEDVQVKTGRDPLSVEFYVSGDSGGLRRVKNRELVLYTALNPRPGRITGESVLSSLPFVSKILVGIYRSIGQNFERVGNVRYAVTYKPSGDIVDRSYAKERAAMIAKEWSDGMRAASGGEIRDFIAVGDVSIKAIGADSQIPDTNIPVRQMLEQIIAKMGIPPFLLGLSWSTTERMSQLQTDILTTELEFYRRLLTPVILQICNACLRLEGMVVPLTVEWDTISLKDEIEEAHARLYLAQAKKIEQETGRIVPE